MNTPYVSAIEPLESRLAPAGIIAVSLSGSGTLVLGNVAGQDGVETVAITKLADGSYELDPGVGVKLRIDGVEYTTTQVVNGVTGGLTVNLGAGNDEVALNNCIFTKPVSINLGAGNNNFTMTDSSIAGTLKITTGDGIDTVLFSGVDCSVGGAVTLKLGGGNDVVTGDANRLNFGAGLTIDGGAGNDQVWLGSTDADNVRLIGALNFIGGAGDDSLKIGTTNTNFISTGAVQLTDTSGNETITIAGVRFEAGAMALKMGVGNNTLNCSVSDFFLARTLQWTSGTGSDNVTIFGGNLKVGGAVNIALGSGGGDARLSANSLYIGGAASLSGSGPERELILSGSLETFIGGKVTMTAGAGEGYLDVFGGVSIYLGAGATLSATTGSTGLSIRSNGNLLSNGAISLTKTDGQSFLRINGGSDGDGVINGSLTMKGGQGNELSMSGTVTGAINMTTSATVVGASTITLQSYNTVGVHVGGNVKLSMPTSNGLIGTVNIKSALIDGTVSVVGGAGADTLNIDNSVFAKGVTSNLGAGADSFKLEQAALAGRSVFNSTLLLQGGAGVDAFLLGGNDAANNGVAFRNQVTADGGTETDSLVIGTQASFVLAMPLKQVSIP